MVHLKEYDVWFVTGSQHLYGEATLNIVDQHSRNIVEGLSLSAKLLRARSIIS